MKKVLYYRKVLLKTGLAICPSSVEPTVQGMGLTTTRTSACAALSLKPASPEAHIKRRAATAAEETTGLRALSTKHLRPRADSKP